ncbi:phage tail protein [Escherichia coli]|nr:phage tail protein [Escherichia coli]
MTTKHCSILTNRGKALEAASAAGGTPVVLDGFVVGDGNGNAVTPEAGQTALVREVYRGTISRLTVSPDQENQFIAYLVLPEGVGGFTVREAGLLTTDGELYAVGSCAAIEKPVNGVTATLQFRLAVAESAQVTLNVATGDGLFLRQDRNLSDVEDKDEAVENLGLKPTVDKAKNAVQRDGDTMTGKLILPQTSAFGVNTENMLGGNSLAIGEGQTGLKQVSGTLSIFVQGNEVFYLEEDTITAMVDILLNGYLSADKVMVASSSGGWIDMRNQSVFLGRNPVSTNSAQALLRQDHADRKYFLGGLGNKQFGIYMINNSRSDNGTDGQAYMDESGNWLCGRQIIPSDYGNFDSRYAKTGASITSVRLGSRQSYSPAGNWYTWTQDLGSGNVMTGIIVQDTGDNSADNIGGIYYRTIQYCVNGTWMNVSSI